MNVDMECVLAKILRIFFSFAVFSMICFGVPLSLNGQSAKRILLPGIETELAQKQIPIDFAETSRALTPLLKKAFSLHGAFRLSHPRESRFSIEFSAKGGSQVGISIFTGNHRIIIS